MLTSPAQAVHAATCKVEGLLAGAVESTGSGFPVGHPGLVATAAHVVQAADQVLVSWAGLPARPASLLALDLSTDLAILEVPGSPDPLPVRAQSPSLGESFVLCGYPQGALRPLLASGIVAGSQETISLGANDVPAFALDATVGPGHSGGPVIDAKGHVMGLVAMRRDAFSGALSALGTSSNLEPAIQAALRQIAAASASGTTSGLGFAVPSQTLDQVALFAASLRSRLRPGEPEAQVEVRITDLASLQATCLAAGLNPVGPFEFAVQGVRHALGGQAMPQARLLQPLVTELLRFKPAGGQVYLAGRRACLHDSKSGKFQAVVSMTLT